MIKHSMIALTRTAFSAAPFGDDETINLVSEESPTVVVLSGSSGHKQASAVLPRQHVQAVVLTRASSCQD